MKRPNVIQTLIVAVILGVPLIARGDSLKPVNPSGSYSGASGNVTTQWKKVSYMVTDWDGHTYRVSRFDGTTSGNVKGLVPAATYAVIAFDAHDQPMTGGSGPFQVDEKGSANFSSSLGSDSSKPIISYYELWSVWIDPVSPWLWYPVELILSSQ